MQSVTGLIGRRLGRYEIRAELGRGGMARVYLALDTQLQRQVALKVLAAQLSLDTEFVRRFEREATTAASLRHPAIVTIYDVGEEGGLHYIAMEYINGQSLATVLQERTRLDAGYAVSLLEPVAQALDYAHAQGAVHRDIKPHNILVDREGRVLLADFGIAQTSEANGERLTRTGIFMGTPEYLSPEQAEARRVDGRSDLYALGVVAYEVLTGRVPFAGSPPQLIVAHAQLPAPPPTSVAAHLPGEFDAIMARALAKPPEARYPSGRELVEAMRSVLVYYGIPLATRAQLADLAYPIGSTPEPPQLDVLPPPAAYVRPPAPSAPPPGAPPPQPEPPPLPRQPASSAGQPTDRAEAAPPGLRVPPRTSARPPGNPPLPRAGRMRAPEAERTRSGVLPMTLIGTLLVIGTILVIMAAARGFAGDGRPPLFPSPTATATIAPTEPPAATAPPLAGSAVPVITPTATAAPSPPTATPLPAPTATPVPPPPVRSPTPVPPTLEPTVTPPPTATPTVPP
ncbi:MAG: serine/threonine protein kinase, partial [Chloroflexia bacterium]|nr:serine/threonine protein kinase [Chloroflexia bacterium]